MCDTAVHANNLETRNKEGSFSELNLFHQHVMGEKECLLGLLE